MINVITCVLMVVWAALFVLMVRADRRRDRSWKRLVEFVNNAQDISHIAEDR